MDSIEKSIAYQPVAATISVFSVLANFLAAGHLPENSGLYHAWLKASERETDGFFSM